MALIICKDLRWGNIPEHYFDHIWESYLKYGKIPRNDNEYLTINGEQNFDLDKIIDHLLK
ncbi:MAG: hypothetical protein U9R32_10090 [Bacteroidota bacterium]|nr:hypothetical protein [Bacteroidota bacterium]